MKLRFRKDIYPLETLIRGLFVFTDQIYIHLDEDDLYYYVEIRNKPQNTDILEKIAGEIENELLAQIVRSSVSKKTGRIRELIYSRAMSSSLILQNTEVFEQLDDAEYYNLEDIIKDWFDGEVYKCE